MNKTSFAVSIHKNGRLNNDILSLIASHNEGSGNINLNDLESYVKTQRILFKYSQGQATTGRSEKHILHISEDDGLTFTVTIEERELIGTIEIPDSKIDESFKNWLNEHYYPAKIEGYYLAVNSEYPLFTIDQLREKHKKEFADWQEQTKWDRTELTASEQDLIIQENLS